MAGQSLVAACTPGEIVHPHVAMSAVGSTPDEIKGELPKAYIVPKAGSEPRAEEILQFCRERLAAYKVPRVVQFVTDLPRTSSGKVMRRALRTLDSQLAGAEGTS